MCKGPEAGESLEALVLRSWKLFDGVEHGMRGQSDSDEAGWISQGHIRDSPCSEEGHLSLAAVFGWEDGGSGSLRGRLPVPDSGVIPEDWAPSLSGLPLQPHHHHPPP